MENAACLLQLGICSVQQREEGVFHSNDGPVGCEGSSDGSTNEDGGIHCHFIAALFHIFPTLELTQGQDQTTSIFHNQTSELNKAA